MKRSPLESILQRWWLVLAFALLGGLIGGIPEPERVEEQATSFTARHTLLSNDAGDTAIISPNQVTLLATTGEVPARVADDIGYGGNPAELASQVVAEYDFASGALTFTTTQETAEQAEVVANGFADELAAYLTERQDQVYQERLNASRQRLQELEDALDEITAGLALSPDDSVLLAERDALSRQYGLAFEQNRALEASPTVLTFTTLERAQAVAQVDRGLSAPASRSTRALMGAAVGAALGVVVALVLGRADRKIRTREQAEELVGLRARVVIPNVRQTSGGVVVSTGRNDSLSDSYRTVRNVVSFIQSGLEPSDRARITLVVSPGPGDGKTSLTSNLAASFLEMGQRTIAVNADFRRPRLYSAITGLETPQLPFDIHELDDLPRRALPLDTTAANMKVLDLSTVPGSPGELVRATMRQIDRFGDISDQIVVDTSPVGATAEVLDLVPHADVIVLVTRVGHTSIQSIDRTMGILRDIATAPIVFVLGGVKQERNVYYEYTGRRGAQDEEPNGDAPAESAAPAALQSSE